MKAVLFRRWTLFRRSIKSILFSSTLSLIFTLLSIVVNFLMKTLLKDRVVPITFNSFLHQSDQIFIANPNQYNFYNTTSNSTVSNGQYQKFLNSLNDVFNADVGHAPNITEFPNLSALNQFMYNNSAIQSDSKWPEFLTMGIVVNSISLWNAYNLTGIYNDSWIRDDQMTARVQLARILWHSSFNSDQNATFTFSSTLLLEKVKDFLFSMLAPMLITCGLASIVPMIISQPLIDMNGDVRQYMISSGLTLFPYWLMTFVVDFILWTVLVNISFIIFICFQITSIMDNLFSYWYTCMMAGPSFILFTYCCSFMFSSAETGARQMFLILIILLILPLFIDIINNYVSPDWILWVYAMIPHVGIQRTLNEILQRVNFFKESFSYYWTWKYSRCYLIMQIVDIPLYSLILYVIEKMRFWIQNKRALKTFENYSDLFVELKSKRIITEEARTMENEVINNSENYAVRILNCSRLFFNTAGEPIAAVNNVSLGVKENSIFGFLGANGAGKTTLIKMISSMLPPSHGTIEVNGINVTKFGGSQINDAKILSICPQFNTHLCEEMTAREHFRLYSYLHQIDNNGEELIEKLGLSEHADKTVREMSGGNQRKLAVALSFFAPASIVLLDEPTSSLDPVARHDVHEMIKQFRGQKTFMVCTHILNEAESLCDTISIMIKGCVYTCGTPQHLSEKFGKEYKVDVILNNDGDNQSQNQCEAFFQQKLPMAHLSIVRQKIRVYAIPSDAITISELFNIMEDGMKNGENGYYYYTCSSSSLERVFMEIVHLSENEDAVFADQPQV